MNEIEYYENPEFWKKDRFLNDSNELERFNAIENLIPGLVNTVVDVGCGNGSFLKFLENSGKTFKCIGLERRKLPLERKYAAMRLWKMYLNIK